MKKLRQKWIPDLPINIYHWQAPYADCLNSSKLPKLAISPRHCQASQKSDPTKSQRIGIIFHGLALGETLHKEDWKTDEWELAEHMANSVLRHDTARSIISNGQHEQSGFYKDPDFGFWSKIRTDVKIDDIGVLADLKSTTDAHPNRFKKDIYWFKYHWQGWLYLRGANTIEKTNKFHTFLIIACEKSPPYGVMIYRLSKAILDQAEQEVMPLLETYKKCLDTGNWPSYPDEIIEV